MPILPSPDGILPFAGVKFVGYMLAGVYLSKQYGEDEAGRVVTPVAFGAARAILGVASGLAMAVGVVMSGHGGMSNSQILVALAPVRFVEWTLLVWLFYERRSRRHLLIVNSALGTLLSYVLDVPAWAAWFGTPGSFVWC
jgi:hypothetical protein